MQTNTRILDDETITQELLNYIKDNVGVNDYEELRGVKVDLNSNKVFILYNDFTEEKQRIQEILLEAMSLGQQIHNETDVIKKVTLQNRLTKLIKEYDTIKTKLNLDIDLHDII